MPRIKTRGKEVIYDKDSACIGIIDSSNAVELITVYGSTRPDTALPLLVKNYTNAKKIFAFIDNGNLKTFGGTVATSSPVGIPGESYDTLNKCINKCKTVGIHHLYLFDMVKKEWRYWDITESAEKNINQFIKTEIKEARIPDKEELFTHIASYIIDYNEYHHVDISLWKDVFDEGEVPFTKTNITEFYNWVISYPGKTAVRKILTENPEYWDEYNSVTEAMKNGYYHELFGIFGEDVYKDQLKHAVNESHIKFAPLIETTTRFDTSKITDVELDGIDPHDHPEYTDAVITSAKYKGKNMTAAELKDLNNNYPEFIEKEIIDHFAMAADFRQEQLKYND